jgi:chemotaxis protein methyltransferase CheR
MGRILKPEDDYPEWKREFVFTDKDFSVLRKLVNQYTGISLSEAKRELVYCRLSRRLRQLNLKSFKNYCELLQDNNGSDEIVHFTNAITTNLTAFFRESHHFEFLNRHILMPYVKRGNGNQRLRIWSAGCSTGEEPYSIAMTIMDSRIVMDKTNVRILATDVDSSVLATARAGVYPLEKLKSIPPHKAQRWFLKGSKINTGYGQVKPALQEFISFRQLNLIHAWPMHGPFDAIFCRNVVIYFNKETQRQLIDRFADILTDGGYLFLGHSESLFKVSDRFRLVSQTVYQKIK